MRVGLIAPPWITVPPRRYGGTERVIASLATGLQGRGHDVVLYTVRESNCPVETAWLYEWEQMRSIGTQEIERRHVAAAYMALADCDVIHDHTEAGVALAARRLGPTVVTLHGPLHARRSDLRFIGPNVSLVAVSSDQAIRGIDVPVERVIHHGLELHNWPVGAGRGGYLACVGRMSPTKGVKEAVVIAGQTGVPLRIAAKMREPAEYHYFRSEVQPLLGSDIEYVGELDQDDTRKLLAEASALLNPIRWHEPFGLVMVEALASGTPVLATRLGAAPEIVSDGETGFLADRSAEFGACLPRIDAIDRKTCRSRVERHFSVDRMVDAYEQLYLDVVAVDRSKWTNAFQGRSG